MKKGLVRFLSKVAALTAAAAVAAAILPGGVFGTQDVARAATGVIYLDQETYSIRVGEVAEDVIDFRLMDVSYDTVLTGEKGLYFKQTYSRVDYTSNVERVKVSVYAPKEGSYRLTISAKDSAGKTVDSVKVNINVSSSDPIKSIKYAGITLSTEAHKLGAKNVVTDKKSGKLKVKMKSGYTLGEIYVGKNVVTADGTTQMQFTKVSNNSNIKLGLVPSNTQVIEDDMVRFVEGMAAETVIRVYYLDQKNKEKVYVDYYLNVLVNEK